MIEALKVHIKKEIVDNYFVDRVYLEEDMDLLLQEAASYRQEVESVSRRFWLFTTPWVEPVAVWSWRSWTSRNGLFTNQILGLGAEERQVLVEIYRRWGFPASRRHCNRLWMSDELQRELEKLREQYAKILTHQRLLNEDIDKFNLSYDFGLIAAQMEALEGHDEVLYGGLLSPEREELSTRMRFKRRKLDEQELPPAAEFATAGADQGPAGQHYRADLSVKPWQAGQRARRQATGDGRPTRSLQPPLRLRLGEKP